LLSDDRAQGDMLPHIFIIYLIYNEAYLCFKPSGKDDFYL